MATGGRSLTSVLDEDILRCSICFELFEDPRVLPCNHTFCLNCLEQISEAKNPLSRNCLVCPLCQCNVKITSRGVEGLNKNFMVNTLLEAKRENTKGCQVCVKGNTFWAAATSMCLSCGLYMCQKCGVTHDETNINHQALPFHKDVFMCPMHKENPIIYFCKECRGLLCYVCALALDHKGHDMSTLEEGRQIYLNKIKSAQDECEKQTINCVEMLEKIYKNDLQLEQQKRDTLISIEDTIESILVAVKSLKTDFQLQIGAFCDHHKQEYAHQTEAVHSEIKRLSDHKNKLESCLNENLSDIEMLIRAADIDKSTEVIKIGPTPTSAKIAFEANPAIDQYLGELNLGTVKTEIQQEPIEGQSSNELKSHHSDVGFNPVRIMLGRACTQKSFENNNAKPQKERFLSQVHPLRISAHDTTEHAIANVNQTKVSMELKAIFDECGSQGLTGVAGNGYRDIAVVDAQERKVKLFWSDYGNLHRVLFEFPATCAIHDVVCIDSYTWVIGQYPLCGSNTKPKGRLNVIDIQTNQRAMYKLSFPIQGIAVINEIQDLVCTSATDPNTLYRIIMPRNWLGVYHRRAFDLSREPELEERPIKLKIPSFEQMGANLQTKGPNHITLNTQNHIILSYKNVGVICIVNLTGDLLHTIGVPLSPRGIDALRFISQPMGLCCDPFNNIVVVDHDRKCIVVISPNGKLLYSEPIGATEGTALNVYPIAVDVGWICDWLTAYNMMGLVVTCNDGSVRVYQYNVKAQGAEQEGSLLTSTWA